MDTALMRRAAGLRRAVEYHNFRYHVVDTPEQWARNLFARIESSKGWHGRPHRDQGPRRHRHRAGPDEATAPSMPLSALEHTQVDHRCRIRNLVPLPVRLARDPREHDTPAATELLQIEHRIAAGIFNINDRSRLEQTGTAPGFNCPECRSSLYEMLGRSQGRTVVREEDAFSSVNTCPRRTR